MNPTNERKLKMMLALFVALIGGGILSLWLYHDEFIHALAHAAIIAGVLGLTVDRYAKWHLVREAARDIDKYLLGYALPAELQDKLREIRNAELVRRSVECEYTISPIEGEKKIRLQTDLTFEVVNITNQQQDYTAELALEKHLSPEITLMECISNDRQQEYELKGPTLRINRRDAVLDVSAKTVRLQSNPKFSYLYYKFHHKYSQIFPDVGSEYFQFDQRYPTIGATIVVKHPKDFDVDFSSEPQSHNPERTEWSNPKVFLRGEIITMWWRPKN